MWAEIGGMSRFGCEFTLSVIYMLKLPIFFWFEAAGLSLVSMAFLQPVIQSSRLPSLSVSDMCPLSDTNCIR